MRKSTLFVLFAGLFTIPIIDMPAAFAQEDALQPPVESSKTFGPYEVLYSIVPTTFVSEAVAASYQITRAKDQAMINVSVRRKVDKNDVAQTAVVKGKYSDLMQSKALTFREVREKDALYYIAVFRHGDKELLRFDLNVQVDPQSPAATRRQPPPDPSAAAEWSGRSPGQNQTARRMP